MNVTHERFSALVIKSKVEELNGRWEEMSTWGMPYKSGVKRAEPDSEHFLAWLCCFFFRISLIQVNFFHFRQKCKNNCMQDNYCLIQAFFVLFVYLRMTSVQASLSLIANMPPWFWYDSSCTDYHITVYHLVRWHMILSIN